MIVVGFLSSSFLVGVPFFASSNIFFLKTSEADDYAKRCGKVKPGKTISFPNDHGSHPSFRLEWWYSPVG